MDTTSLNKKDQVSFKDLLEGYEGTGNFLLCRTVSPVGTGGGGDMMVVAVTDPEASQKTGVSIKNYSSAILNRKVNLEDVLPQGMYLALKNPNPKTLVWDNPNHIQLLSPKDVEVIMGEDVKWSTLNAQDDPHSFWTSKTEEAIFFNKLRACGNKLFTSGCFSDAIRFYDLALQYASTNEERSFTLSNRAAALLRLGCHNAALVSSQKAMDLDSGNVKAIYRHAQALVALGRFEEAVVELEEALKNTLKERGALEEMLKMATERKDTPSSPKTEIFSARMNVHRMKKSTTDRLSRVSLAKQVTDSIQEYIGPVEIKLCETEGKGHGLFATEDISPGQIILLSRALAYHKCEELVVQNPEGLRDPCFSHLLTTIAIKLHFEPSLGSQFYELSAGKELGYLEKDDPRNSLVDVKRMEGIMKNNPSVVTAPPTTCCGFWTLPSFINHSCSGLNCTYDGMDDLMTVKAVKRISKGTEILWSYVDETLTYEDRRSLLKTKFGIKCNCDLCTWELKERKSVSGLRLSSFKALLGCEADEDQDTVISRAWKELLPEADFVEDLWKELKLTGLVPFHGLQKLGSHLLGSACQNQVSVNPRRLREAFKIAKFCVSVAGHGADLITTRMNIHPCLYFLGLREEMLANLRALKEELVLWFGSVQGIHLVLEEGGGFVEDLQEQGLDFFSI